MKKSILLAIGLVAVFVGFGQSASVKATIDFQFTAGGKVLPPGQYEFVRETTAPVFRIQGEGKNSVTVPILTRLAGAMHTTPEDAHLVFDKVGDTYLLSEIWFPAEDGFLVFFVKGAHEHKAVNIKY